MLLKTLLTSLTFLAVGSTLNAQITVDPTPTPTQLVEDYLIGAGVSVSNITFTGDPTQRGIFDGSASNIGLPGGVMLSSGRVIDCVPPAQPDSPLSQFGNPGDPDLLTVAQSVTSNPDAGLITTTNDAAILEFDFIPAGDIVEFNFVFSSEEYLTYINSQFNDAFGFFISGPGFAGPFAAPAAFPLGAENLAVVPGTADPITISTIHPGLNATFYIDDPAGPTQSFNGFTIPMTISFNVTCGETYHFKFAVADCQDDWLDTGVFLEGGSFSANPVELTLQTNTGDTSIYEGCGTYADFFFTRPDCGTLDSLIAYVAVSGTSTEGLDYALIPDSVLFLPGQDTVTIPFTALPDGIFEGSETLTLTITTITITGDTLVSSATVWILDEPNVTIFGHDTTVFCIGDSLMVFADGANGVIPYTYLWSTSPDTTLNTFTTVPIDANGAIDYYITIIDACGFTGEDTLTVVVDQTLALDSLTSFWSSQCAATGIVSAYPTGVTSVLSPTQFHWDNYDEHTLPGSGSFWDDTTWSAIPSGWYYCTVTDDVCTVNDSIWVEAVDLPVADFTAGIGGECSPVTVLFTNTSLTSATYEWDFGGTVVNVSNQDPITQTFTSTSIIQLIAYDATGCADTTSTTINVITCGCMDPTATNYNPAAVQDDGSCYFPQPTVVAPNIFTPNGDGNNDVFFLEVTNAVNVDIVIINRWGNQMFNQSGLNLAWDGTVAGSGELAEDGTYFVTYTVTGIPGTDSVSGHGFVQLVTDGQ